VTLGRKIHGVALSLTYHHFVRYNLHGMSVTPITSLGKDEVRWARQMPSAEKLAAGARLFDYACSIMVAGIRKQHPAASDEQVLEILRERLEWSRRWE
jgi:hypothetical protein